MIIHLTQFTDLSLVALRGIVSVVFFSSGLQDVRSPDKRARSIGMNKSFTIVLGIGELAAALGILFGVFIQLAALGLMLIMAGAIYKKIFVWRTPFFDSDSGGWHYDLIFFVINFVLLTTAGGRFTVL